MGSQTVVDLEQNQEAGVCGSMQLDHGSLLLIVVLNKADSARTCIQIKDMRLHALSTLLPEAASHA